MVGVSVRRVLGREVIPRLSPCVACESVASAIVDRDYSVRRSATRLLLFGDRPELHLPELHPNPSQPGAGTAAIKLPRAVNTTLLARWRALNCPTTSQHFLIRNNRDGVPIILYKSLRLSVRKAGRRVIDAAGWRVGPGLERNQTTWLEATRCPRVNTATAMSLPARPGGDWIDERSSRTLQLVAIGWPGFRRVWPAGSRRGG